MVAVVVIGVVGGWAVGKEFSARLEQSAASARASQIERTLKTVAQRVKKTLPEKLNAVTTMIGISYEQKVMTYVYDLDTRGEAPHEVIATLRELVGERACVGEFKDAMHYGYAFTFRYNSPRGAKLGEFTLSAANCA